MDARWTHFLLALRSVALAEYFGCHELGNFQDIILTACVDEDEPPRWLNHFYDPDTNHGLVKYSWVKLVAPQHQLLASGDYFPSALEWAWNGMPDHLDWVGAIKSYDYTEASRKQAYEALGHVLHLLQDMGQPDHATNRPHPGNLVHKAMATSEFLREVAPSSIREDRVGYEELWARFPLADPPLWPSGTAYKDLRSLKQAFDELAKASKRAETNRQLPSTRENEIALGLAALKENLGVRVLHFLIELFEGKPPKAIAYDPKWANYELDIPLVPTIPIPPEYSNIEMYGAFTGNINSGQDPSGPPDPMRAGRLPIPIPHDNPHRENYYDLGRELLPLTEEYGAGLLALFYKIVNPPPFVESVQIEQELVRMGDQAPDQYGPTVQYSMAWEDSQPGQNGHLQTRIAKTSAGSVLEPGRRAWVKIKFGPWLNGSANFRQSRTVDVLRVWIEYESGTNEDVLLVSRGTEYWWGSFVPLEGGTLVIEARDAEPHFEGRSVRGDLLDSDPSTPARAIVIGLGPSAEYGWDNYEPGSDRKHHFTVHEDCQPHCVGAALMRKLRYGSWKGELHIKRKSETKERFDFQPGGRIAPYWSEQTRQYEDSVDYEFSFRSICEENSAQFGRVDGMYKIHKRETIRMDGKENTTDLSPSGKISDLGGQLALFGPDRGRFGLGVTLHWDETDRTRWIDSCIGAGYFPLGEGPPNVFSGTMCEKAELEVSGNLSAPPGGDGSVSEGGGEGIRSSQVTWSAKVAFDAPGDPPEHATLCVSGMRMYGDSFNHLIREQARTVISRVESLFRPLLPPRRPGSIVRPEAEKVSAALWQGFTDLANEVSPARLQALEGNLSVLERCGQLDELWLRESLKDEYARELEELKSALDQLKNQKRDLEERLAGGVESLAKIASDVDTGVSNELEDLAHKLRNDGLNAFGIGIYRSSR